MCFFLVFQATALLWMPVWRKRESTTGSWSRNTTARALASSNRTVTTRVTADWLHGWVPLATYVHLFTANLLGKFGISCISLFQLEHVWVKILETMFNVGFWNCDRVYHRFSTRLVFAHTPACNSIHTLISFPHFCTLNLLYFIAFIGNTSQHTEDNNC